MKQLLTIIGIFIISSGLVISNEISSAVEYKAQPFDVLRYTADIKFKDFTAKDISGKCLIDFLWLDKNVNNRFFFNLKGLSVDSCFYNGKKVIAQVSEVPIDEDNYYIINPENDFSDTSELMIYYSGIMSNEAGPMPWGGVTYQDSVLFAMGVGFHNPYVSSTRFWLPCYDHPSDKAMYRFRFTVPDSLLVVSNGNLLIEEPTGNGKMSYRWSGEKEAATYMLTFAVGKFSLLEFGNDTISMPVYTLEKNINKCNIGFKLLPKMVNIYEQYFGKYPFEKVGYVVAPIGSMEHQTMITLAEDVLSLTDTVSSTVAHELSHQWFGGLVTPYDYRDAWLNEAFATYSEALYAESLFDKTKYLHNIGLDINRYISNSVNEGIFPLWDFERVIPSSNYPATIYYKGSAVLAMLRYELGDEIFFKSIKNYLGKFANSNATTADLIEVINETSGRDLSEFFAQWVFGRGYPSFKINTFWHPYPDNDNMGYVDIIVKQVQNAGWGIYTNVPLEVNFSHSSTERTIKILNIKSIEESFHLDSVAKFTNFAYNSGYELKILAKVNTLPLSIDEQNNMGFEIYPNPVEDYLSILNFAAENLLSIRIYDITGVCIKEINPKNNYGLVNTESLNRGTYQLVLTYSDITLYKLFCK